MSVCRLAVLIDADNASAKIIGSLLKEVAKYGTANVKRIYGDWTNTQLVSWKNKLNAFAIQPIQQFSYTTGKNATDSALIIDAMDLLYTGNFDGFCIVSSDSDFTRLASRIREAGLVVYGFGEQQKTPGAFISACNKFIYTDILDLAEEDEGGESADNSQNKNSNRQVSEPLKSSNLKNLGQNKKLIRLLKNAYESVAGDDGWAYLAAIGSQLNKLSSDFDARNYGCKKLGELVGNVGIFEIKEVRHKKNSLLRQVYIKLK
ncbi:NYN domain-containing protein [Lyngbya sp. CCY1209]|jgi:uncharacterized LabA/DUF88 family protein|uniref:NYN domain-containing protein n=1 Tax=Lyngbya sp. CCY1209 TaxID=2886103 RepID=UPI002D212519|nr:NYN domain-containing protein [Lyngbya sp. CCY1209]MEB3881888.1 NYN domain-containing protein [Lyngbya sp. CCY1209]